MFTQLDYLYMSHALRLAEKGLYTTSPNPRVGCVIVKDGNVVGTGWHMRAGEPHAEVHALQAAGALAKGSSVYVTLEPCSHHGRTPPCVEALIQAGVSKVVMAMNDPNPNVDGRGEALLQQAGIKVQTGLMAMEAETLNIGFVSRMRYDRPWVRMKIAASLDGKTALKNGKSQWITGEAARRDGHKWRARSCAVLTGIGSVKHDDPQLTVRYVDTSRQPVRIVVDTKLEISPQAKLLESGDPVWIFTAQGDEEKIHSLTHAGARVIVLPDKTGKVDLTAMMARLAGLEINELLIEAGATLNGALVAAGLVDEMILYLAPNLLGDSAQDMLIFPELSDLSEKYNLRLQDVRKIGTDIRLIAGLK
jgi:diaminohydroxyphosphoribosylaminopyrimidine deaminase/5-amino-6-(5-phosphoribosylamino)uracil reductase